MFTKNVSKVAAVVAFVAAAIFASGSLVAQCSCGGCQAGAASYFDSGGGGCSSGGCSGGCDGGFASGISDYSSGCNSAQGPSPCVDECCNNLGPYVSLFGGLSTIHQFEQQIVVPAAMAGDPNIDEFRNFSGDSSGAYGIAIGRLVHQRARTELEYTLRDNMDLDSFRVQQFTDDILTAETNTPVVGNIETMSLMGNFLFDFSPRCVGRANLYGGAGIGILDVNGTASGGGTDYEIDDTTFAYQLIAGLNYAARQRVDFYTEYRFMHARVNVDDVTAGSGLGAFDFETNSVFLGVRFRR